MKYYTLFSHSKRMQSKAEKRERELNQKTFRKTKCIAAHFSKKANLLFCLVTDKIPESFLKFWTFHYFLNLWYVDEFLEYSLLLWICCKNKEKLIHGVTKNPISSILYLTLNPYHSLHSAYKSWMKVKLWEECIKAFKINFFSEVFSYGVALKVNLQSYTNSCQHFEFSLHYFFYF